MPDTFSGLVYNLDVDLDVCRLLGRAIQCDSAGGIRQLSPLSTCNGMFRFTITELCPEKLVSTIRKSRDITRLPPQTRCHVTLACYSAPRRYVLHLPTPRSHPHFAPLSFRLLSLSCRLYSLIPSLSHPFLPLHHRLAAFRPFSPQPDGSQMRRLPA